MRPLTLIFACLLASMVQAQQPQAQDPGMRLGLKVRTAANAVPTLPQVVVVPDGASYLAQISAWSLAARWPVLIDDGTDDARENIARFVRSFQPRVVMRWSAPDAAAASRASIEQAIAGAWDAESMQDVVQMWMDAGVRMPGVVMASPDHSSWTAAVALCAGRAQSIAWYDVPRRNPGGQMASAEFDALDAAVVRAAKAHDAWSRLGDDFDVVTLCLEVQGRLQQKGEILALTDRIGRHADGRRYAWCAQIIGTESQAAYRAMSALFVPIRGAWLFDAYNEKRDPSGIFDARLAAELLQEAGIPVTLTPKPVATVDAWRTRSRAGVTASLVDVNSSGMANWFELVGGRAFASDVPQLNLPAIVHFTHSFSAQRVDRTTTIANRWLANGAAVYIGSVDEPFLPSFQPPKQFMGRLLVGMPVVAAARMHEPNTWKPDEPWKIQVLGDPLMIALPPVQLTAAPQPPDGAVTMRDEMARALQAQQFDVAARALVMTGRDADAVRLAQAALATETVTAEMRADVARETLGAVFRQDDAALFAKLYRLLRTEEQEAVGLRAMLWQALRHQLRQSAADASVVDLLRRHIRMSAPVADASTLRGHVLRLYGEDAVRAMYLDLIERTENQRTRTRLREAMGG
ncbi:MAG: hypothetical protein AAFX05_04980 [Planctomycetota bacterium]